jgi:hypothetical protein
MTDSINYILVDSILKKYGFLSYKEIGYKANNSLAILYQHLDTNSFMDNFYLVERAYKKKSILSRDYALILDRYLMQSGKEQEFGTQFYYDSVKKNYLFYPIKDFNNIENKRREIGLDSLATYARNNKIFFDNER